jgi:hypothetical protein
MDDLLDIYCGRQPLVRDALAAIDSGPVEAGAYIGRKTHLPWDAGVLSRQLGHQSEDIALEAS